MAKPQRKDEIMKSDIPPELPLMALRSTIVYPLGTIAVQMGAPENLALLRGNEGAGLIVALVVAKGDHDDPVDPQRRPAELSTAGLHHHGAAAGQGDRPGRVAQRHALRRGVVRVDSGQRLAARRRNPFAASFRAANG